MRQQDEATLVAVRVDDGIAISDQADQANRKPPTASVFASMQRALAVHNQTQPALVIDLDALNANLAHLASSANPTLAIRIVAKSLPSANLLRHVLGTVDTDRLMTFNLPTLITIATEFPDADQLCGKPFPVAAAAQAIDAIGADAAGRVQWLVDTTDRLDQYERLATERGINLRVCLELDVGLHRGGFPPRWELEQALRQIAASPSLTFAGFMGYEPHVAKMPAGRLRTRAFDKAMESYRKAVSMAASVLGQDAIDAAVLNAAGSPTYALHDETSPATEISIGSALLKGTDFDTDLLTGFTPAIFIATPVLKVLRSAEIPAFEAIEEVKRRIGATSDRAIFVHGGHWLADGVYPTGLRNDSVFGRSSNQEMFRIPADARVAVDDFVFLRPTQTESVLLQFGDILVHQGGRIIDQWPAFPPSV